MAVPKPPPKKKGVLPGGGPPTNPLKPQGAAPLPLKAAPSSPAAKAATTQVLGSTRSPARAPNDRVMVGAGGRVTLSTGRPRPEGAAQAAAEEAEPAQPRIEDIVLAGLKAPLPETPLFGGFVERIGPKIRLPRTCLAVLESLSSIDVTAEKVGQIIGSNQYYNYHFLRVIETLGKRREVPAIEGALILLGMQNSRDLVIALQAYRMIHQRHPEWDKNGKLKIDPAEVLCYARKAEEFAGGSKGGYAESAYAAGLLFDLFVMMAEGEADRKRALLAFIDSVFAHGLKTAQIGTEIAKSFPELVYKKYVFAACLVHDIGKVAMGILEPTYVDFYEDCQKRELSRRVRLFAERRKYGTDHAVMGGLCCNYYQFLRPVERSVFHHHDPFLLRRRQRNLFQLAAIISLASNIARNFRKTDKPNDPIIKKWIGPELGDFRMDIRALLTAVSKSG